MRAEKPPTARTVEEYTELPYRMDIYRDEGCWAAEFPELPYLVAASQTWEGLQHAIEDAKRAYFESMIEEGKPIPKPRARDGPSGKLVVRLPRVLHAEAARAAEQQGVSLNTFIVSAVAKEVGRRQV